jgi:hypothetical protein
VEVLVERSLRTTARRSIRDYATTEETIVGLGKRVGTAVLKRIEASPGVQAQVARSERTAPVTRAARKAAHSPLDDATVAAELGEQLDAAPSVTEEAIPQFDRRDDYINDRAYRLLKAVAAETAVEQIPPERAELFREEEALGRMPMEDAFRRLCELEPGLGNAKTQTERAATSGNSEACGLPKELREPLARLVGGGARSDRELLHSSLATSIVHQYLGILAGDQRSGAPEVSYFESPVKHVVTTGVLFDLSRFMRHRSKGVAP